MGKRGSFREQRAESGLMIFGGGFFFEGVIRYELGIRSSTAEFRIIALVPLSLFLI
jgi:hypothetical protein